MPDYKDKLRSASFRGVPFGVLEAETESGRRTQIYEFPQKDVPYVEDLGRKARNYVITAFVCGTSLNPDYMDQRDNLIGVLEQEGPGVLVHPYLGELTLQVLTFRVRETKDDGGMASFSITFAETGAILYPTTSNNAAADVSSNAGNLAALLVNGMTGFSASAANLAQNAANDINNAVNMIRSVTTPFMRVIKNADQINRSLNGIMTNVSVLIKTPGNLADSFMNVISSFQNTIDTMLAFNAVNAVVNSFQSIYSGRTYENSATGVQQKANDTLMVQMLVLSGASTAALIATQIQYTTVEQADEIASAVDAMIDFVIYSVTDDNIYQAVIDLKVALHQAVPSNSAVLKTIQSYQVKNSIPALVLCYQIYGSLDNFDDLINRNDISNPACIPGGTTLQVLSQ
jgi:prophage DNA circulation protein